MVSEGEKNQSQTYQIRLPQSLTCSKQLIAGGAGDNKVLCKIDTPDAIKATYKRLARGMIDPRNDRADEERPEPFLVQAGGDQVGHGLGRDGPLLAEPVHVDLVAKQVRHRRHVRGKACQPQIYVLPVPEDLGEIVGHREGLEAKSEIARDGNAVFPDHGYAGATV